MVKILKIIILQNTTQNVLSFYRITSNNVLNVQKKILASKNSKWPPDRHFKKKQLVPIEITW